MSVVRIAVQCQDKGAAAAAAAVVVAAVGGVGSGVAGTKTPKQHQAQQHNGIGGGGIRSASTRAATRSWLRCTMEPRHWMAPLVVLCVWALACCASYLWGAMETPFPQSRRVLFVTAHPDDETIFFSPSILSLRAAGREVFLMCLSTGNAYGMGEVRRTELQNAVATLGIDADHLILMDHPELQDGKQSEWSTAAIGQLVTEMQQKHNIDTIVTFDDAGITQHPNHLAVHAGIRLWVKACEEGAGQGGCPMVWELVTAERPGGRKMSVLGSLRHAAAQGGAGRFEPRRASAAGYVNRNVLRTFGAMAAHRSQSKWWAHVLTMRYTMVNVYNRVTGFAPPSQPHPTSPRR